MLCTITVPQQRPNIAMVDLLPYSIAWNDACMRACMHDGCPYKVTEQKGNKGSAISLSGMFIGNSSRSIATFTLCTLHIMHMHCAHYIF